MQSAEPPKPRKRPVQSRSQLLVDAIEQACLQVLQQEGPEKLSTQRIADVAGVNIASLYQYFPNKEAILAEVYQRQLEKMVARAQQQFAELEQLSRQSLEKTLAYIIRMEASQLLELRELDASFFHAYRHSFDIHSRINDLAQSLKNPSWEQWFGDFLELHRSTLRSTDIQTLSFIARHTLQGNLHTGITESPEMIQSEAFQRELLDMLMKLLQEMPHS